jgi:hypothetical protein
VTKSQPRSPCAHLRHSTKPVVCNGSGSTSESVLNPKPCTKIHLHIKWHAQCGFMILPESGDKTSAEHAMFFSVWAVMIFLDIFHAQNNLYGPKYAASRCLEQRDRLPQTLIP